ncbi:MAG: hypothetical protein C5S38_00750 [Candidatus Methanophagaceae archaeon]|nr:MAG: hypothetical protein C5S38_00750 [Methanophagales archaeon]
MKNKIKYLKKLRDSKNEAGGIEKIEKRHSQGKMTAK